MQFLRMQVTHSLRYLVLFIFSLKGQNRNGLKFFKEIFAQIYSQLTSECNKNLNATKN